MATKSTVFGAALAISGLLFFNALSMANEVQITISGVGDPTTAFTLPENPTPTSYTENSFTLGPVEQLTNGVAVADTYTFYNISAGGGLSDGLYYHDRGVQLFSGPASRPTFMTGSSSDENADSDEVDMINLTSIPEMSTWTLMLAGFASIALAGAHRQSRQRIRCKLTSGQWADEI